MNALLPPPEVHYRWWLRIEDFLRLQSADAFADIGKVELIEGEILKVNAQFARHSYAKSQLHILLDRALREMSSGLVAMVEASVAMPPFDLPEPDIIIAERPRRGGPMAADDVVLLIEVADSSRRFDLGRKAFVYARSRIAEYWVCDLVDNVIVRHVRPGHQGYDLVDRVPFGEIVLALTLPGLTVPTIELLDLPTND